MPLPLNKQLHMTAPAPQSILDMNDNRENQMSNYSVVNLHEIKASTNAKDGVDGRFARKYLDSRDLGISSFRYAPNYRAKRAHSHKVQEEAYVVAQGSGQILLDGEVVPLKQWDVVRVAPEVTRAFEAGPDGLELIAVGGPKPEGGDGVMQEPNWPAS
jgi:mannose-6-phosphate isomerase-like protein (cupin superfamily)